VTALRTPWAACSVWPPTLELQSRFYTSEQHEASKAADSRAGSGQQQQYAGSYPGSEDAEQAALAGQDAVDEGTATIEELQSLLTKAQEDAAAFKDRWQRSHAEMQNLIARQARDKETMQTYAVQGFAKSLLEVADNLESAQKAIPTDVLQQGADVPAEKALGYLKSLLEGVQATERVLHKLMADKGVQRIATAEGDEFNPNNHEAMSTVPRPSDDKQPGAVATVWQSGYKMHDRVIRAAKVLVYQE
jgi:molecular chaperone GrpE